MSNKEEKKILEVNIKSRGGMSKSQYTIKVLRVLSTLIIISLTFILGIVKGKTKKSAPEVIVTTNCQTFYAKIEDLTEKNDYFLIVAKGLEINDINYRGKFIFAIRDDTILTWRGIEIKSYDLVQGNNIAITFVDKELDDVLPTPIKEVIKVQLLDDKIASKS